MLKKIFLILLVILIIGLIGAYWAYGIIFKDNIKFSEPTSLYIKTGTTYNNLIDQLKNADVLNSWTGFETLAQKMNLDNNLHPGHYTIEETLSNIALVRKLRGGHQDPVKVTFNKHRTIENLASTISQQIEPDSAAFINLLKDSTYLQQLNLDSATVLAHFIPNTYEVYWNTSAEKFIKKMMKASNNFWNDNRLGKAKSLDLTTLEVITLASIVEEETNKNDELGRVAGVYLNRLKKGWHLQADPTVKFAVNDFTLKRILNKHLEVDSPYNTYKVTGLPPGPICLPSTKTIDAVLNAENHSYMYFCAKEDFSGYHNFSQTLAGHNANARKYHKALNKRKIF